MAIKLTTDERKELAAIYNQLDAEWLAAGTACQLRLVDGENSRISRRIRRDLVPAAKARSGIASDTALLEYALAKVALEDEFGAKLVRRKGRLAKDVDLEF